MLMATAAQHTPRHRCCTRRDVLGYPAQVRSSPAPRLLRATAIATLGAICASTIAAGATFPPLPGEPPEPPSEDPRSPRPDIVAFVLDDIPPMDGRLWQKLPNIQRYFVEQGTQFSDAHVQTPTCTPGRAGLLTGLHTHHHGAFMTDGTLFDPRETIATELQAEGYHTIQVGKYLNLMDRFPDKRPPGWNDFHGSGGRYYDYNLYSNGNQRWYGSKQRDYSPDVTRRIALKTLKRAPDRKPIFAWFSPYSMHKPWAVSKREQKRDCRIKSWKPKSFMEQNVRDKPAYVRARTTKSRGGYKLKRICRGMRTVDRMVGQVVRQLKRDDRYENTLLVLTSDNGMAFGAQRILHDKKAPYGTQIPMMVHWPRVLGTEPRTIDEKVQNIDLAPTLCDIAGCRLGPFPTGQARADGVSFLRLLTGERERLARRTVLNSYQETGHRVPTYWSIQTTGSSPLARQGCARRKEAGCRWIYTVYATGERELYDVSNGPCHEWRRSQKGDPCMLRNRAGATRLAGLERALKRELNRLRPGP
jgi:arylsulfatase A-like enzyme